MSLSLPSTYYDNAEGFGTVTRSGVELAAPTNRVPGDLLLATLGSYHQPSSVNTGWTQITSAGSAGSYVTAYWRTASGDANDNLAVSFSTTGGSYAASITIVRTTFLFDSASIKSYSANAATGAGASYALSSGLTGVSAGELSVVMGGNHGLTSYLGNNTSITGTSWTSAFGGGGFFGGQGGVAVGYNTVTPTPAVPSVAYDDATHTFGRFVFAAVIREGTGGGVAGGGLFWGAP